jgi:Na+/alanine symporter
LAGVFGIDFAGDVLRGLLVPVYLVAMAVGVGLSYLLGPSMPQTSWTISGHAYTWVPVVIILYVIFCVGSVLTACVESIKTIYFTIFYTAITRPDVIQPGLHDQLTHYLQLGQTTPPAT